MISTNKLTTELTDDELLNLVSDIKDEPKQIEQPHDVLAFIQTFNLKPGKIEVRRELIYKLYKEWSKFPIHKRTFHNYMGYYFDVVKARANTYNYKMNLKMADVLQKTYEIETNYDRTKQKNWKTHFDNFLKFYNIQKGTFYISSLILYNLYDKWVYNNETKNRIGSNVFTKFCKLYFKNKVVQNAYYFGVDKTILNHLSEEMMKKLKKQRKKRVPKEKDQKTTG